MSVRQRWRSRILGILLEFGGSEKLYSIWYMKTRIVINLNKARRFVGGVAKRAFHTCDHLNDLFTSQCPRKLAQSLLY